MTKVAAWVRLDIQPGKREEALGIIQIALDAVEAEPGTIRYLVHTDPKDENVIYFYETYADREALAAHGGSEWMKAFGPKLAPVLAGRPDMKFVDAVGGKGF